MVNDYSILLSCKRRFVIFATPLCVCSLIVCCVLFCLKFTLLLLVHSRALTSYIRLVKYEWNMGTKYRIFRPHQFLIPFVRVSFVDAIVGVIVYVGEYTKQCLTSRTHQHVHTWVTNCTQTYNCKSNKNTNQKNKNKKKKQNKRVYSN